MKIAKMISILAISIFLCMPSFAGVIFQDNFDEYTNTITGWSQVASSVTLDKTGGIKKSQCARVNYTGEGTGPYWFSYNISSHHLSDIYVRFYFKVDNPSGGCKFLKLFGHKDSTNGAYANTTFMIDYTKGELYDISYGDGSTLANDCQDVITYKGTSTDSNISILKYTDTFDPRDGKWHSFEAHIKYNDNGQRNGVYQVWIDGKLWLYATNIKNRNDLDPKYFNSVDLANYCSRYFEHSWNLWYDDVVISTDPIGPFVPSGLRISK